MRFNVLLLAMAAMFLWACTGPDITVPNAKPTTGRVPNLAEVPDPEETVRGEKDPPIVRLELGSQLRERRLSRTEPLPAKIIVPNTNLSAVPVTAALQAVLAGTDVSLSWEAGVFENRLVTVSNLSGPLPMVVDKICASAKVFCGYRKGLLELRERETFIIELPTVPSADLASSTTNTMAETIGELAGEKVRIDQQGGNLLYTSDVDGYDHVSEYLAYLRQGRPLVVMQFYIWEVTLDRDNGKGINWSKFEIPDLGGHAQKLVVNSVSQFMAGIATAGGVSVGAAFTGKVNADVLFRFLSTQGQVQTVSNPQLTFVSGSNAEFKVGGKQRYISQVGTLNSVSGSVTNASNSTITTDSLDTGLRVSVNGSFESGVISALLELELQDVIRINPTTMEGGMLIDLPETSERRVSTSVRIRPGDNLLLAGLVSSRDDNNREDIPLFSGIPTYKRDQLRNSELVILVKPSVVQFVEKKETPRAPASARLAASVQNSAPDAVFHGQNAVVVDQDGAQQLVIPDAPQAVVQVASQPELAPISLKPADLLHQSVSEKFRESDLSGSPPGDALPPVASLPSQAAPVDSPPVDSQLMQQSLSSALETMPPSSLQSGGT
ncbi:MAG: hypothetical protein FWF24_02920 [Alphaproteobacteria bacterium]|nr:hypothetical protein [Alphaproteobacteria bacterium]